MDAAAALSRAAEAGIHCLQIPTPFLVGRVNTYLIEDDPLTLIDSGPNSGKALDELERQLAGLGRRVEDLERIVITHQHIDHLGLVDILARRSGAQVVALDRLAPYVAGYSERSEDDDRFAEAVMLRHGILPETTQALRSVSRAFRAWGSGAQVTRTVSEGDRLEFAGRTLAVHHRPGHSPSDTVFWDEQRQILIAADHLIAHISSNPLISRPLPAPGDPPPADPEQLARERPRALMTYMESLRATRAMPAEIVLSGHGEPITAHAALIDSRFRMHERRAAKIGKLISERPMTAHELAQSLWGDIAVTQAYLTLSEVLGHADLLLAEGAVVEQEEHGIVRFARGR